MSTARGAPGIGSAIRAARQDKKRAALVAYLMAGYPDAKSFHDAAVGVIAAGADVLEIGVPFSDPIADGKVIQAAGEAALRSGVTLGKSMVMAGDLRKETDRPMVLMSYLNPIYVMGFERFVDEAMAVGVDGVIIPDLLPNEADEYIAQAASRNFALVFLASSNGTDERLKLSMSATSGFLYALALAGVTGERESLDAGLLPFVARLKGLRAGLSDKSELPVGVGFGVSKAEHFSALKNEIDAVVVGSAVVKRQAEGAAKLKKFVAELLEDGS